MLIDCGYWMVFSFFILLVRHTNFTNARQNQSMWIFSYILDVNILQLKLG